MGVYDLLRLQFVALLCLTHTIREDALGEQSLSRRLVLSGVLRYVMDDILDTDLGNSSAKDIEALKYFNHVMVCISDGF